MFINIKKNAKNIQYVTFKSLKLNSIFKIVDD